LIVYCISHRPLIQQVILLKMVSLKEKLYRELRTAFGDANAGIKYKEADQRVSKIWSDLKSHASFPNNVQQEIDKWKTAAKNKRKTLDNYWVQPPTIATNKSSS